MTRSPPKSTIVPPLRGENRAMSRPIPLDLPPRDPREELRVKLEQAPLEHAEAVLAGFELLQALHDQGVLDLLRGALGARDKLLGIAVEAANSPEAIRGIRNFILLTKFFASIPPEALNGLVENKSSDPPGVLQLMGKLRSEESRRAIATILDVIEALGRR